MIFVVQLPKVAGGCRNFVGFQGGKWRSVHIDELHETNDQLLRFNELVGRSVSQLFKPLNDDDGRFDEEVEQMDVDPYIVPEGESINDENYSANQKFNAALILRNCLQAAAARLDDESPNIDRATNRIEILLNMLPKDDSRETGKL